ncbi:MAG: hypothetical protein ABWY54_07935 [Glaciihabitans sp.]
MNNRTNDNTNDNINETRPYPDDDPMRDLLNNPAAPIPDAAESRSAQDAMTTESFAWTATPGESGVHASAASTSDAAMAEPRVEGLPSSGVSRPQETPASTDPAPRQSTPARAGTIVWGCVLFLVAALAAVPAILGEAVLTPVAILWIVVGFGTLLVVGGIVGAIIRTSTRTSQAERSRTY